MATAAHEAMATAASDRGVGRENGSRRGGNDAARRARGRGGGYPSPPRRVIDVRGQVSLGRTVAGDSVEQVGEVTPPSVELGWGKGEARWACPVRRLGFLRFGHFIQCTPFNKNNLCAFI